MLAVFPEPVEVQLGKDASELFVGHASPFVNCKHGAGDVPRAPAVSAVLTPRESFMIQYSPVKQTQSPPLSGHRRGLPSVDLER